MSDGITDAARQTERALEIFRANNSPDSAKKHQSFQENMKRLHGEIERMIYAAEIACNTASGNMRDCPRCPFNIRVSEPVCPVEQLRDIIGDHVEQDDCMRECPR